MGIRSSIVEGIRFLALLVPTLRAPTPVLEVLAMCTATVRVADPYEVRGSTAFIAPKHWDVSIIVPDPAPDGTTQSMTVTGLEENETYDFAMTVFDEEGNSPGISNCVGVTCFEDVVGAFPDPALEALRGLTNLFDLDLSHNAIGNLEPLAGSIAIVNGLEPSVPVPGSPRP